METFYDGYDMSDDDLEVCEFVMKTDKYQAYTMDELNECLLQFYATSTTFYNTFSKKSQYTFETSYFEVSEKNYDKIPSGRKEHCLNMIYDSWIDARNSDSFYHSLLYKSCVSDDVVQYLTYILQDMISVNAYNIEHISTPSHGK
jgi:hypothetical protein